MRLSKIAEIIGRGKCPGGRIKSKGAGRGLVIGRRRGPRGIPAGAKGSVAELLEILEQHKRAQHLENVTTPEAYDERETARALRDAIIAEESAINQYEAIADATKDAQVRKVVQDIANEEKVHVGELQKLLKDRLPNEQGFLDEGAGEVEKD